MRLLQHPDLDSLRESSIISLTNGVSLTVFSLPITFEMEFKAKYPEPADDVDSSDYNLLRAAAIISRCVDPEEVAFTADPEDYPAILKELSAFLTPGQMMALGTEITKISGVQEEEVVEATKDFTERGQA
jgi:hypothetical protein